MVDQKRAPIWEAMVAYRSRRTSRFHVPGHKGGSGLDIEAEERILLEGVLSVDLTEIFGLDDLHQPEGVIAEAEQLAAECYGAARTHFLVGGSTSGNLALILALCKPGDVLLVQRDAHKSVLNGLMLAGARAVFIAPRVDSASGLPCGARLEDVEEALRRYPEAVGLLLTDPNYYGRGVDMRPLVEAAHARAVPVLVDAAHGAHYGFHPALPGGAVAAGADAVVHSTHKMLTAMTMGAMLHVQGGLLDRAAIARALRTLQSSSPSYPILASLDLARRQLSLRGERLLGEAAATAARLRERLAPYAWLRYNACGPHEDPLKLVLADRTGTLDGFELQSELEALGCTAEMADPEHVVLALGLSTGEVEQNHLLSALEQINGKYRLSRRTIVQATRNIAAAEPYTRLSEPIAFRYHAASDVPSTPVRLADAEGLLAAELIVPYPPGVPLLYPGEQITRSHIAQLQLWMGAGSRIHGLNPEGAIPVKRRDDN